MVAESDDSNLEYEVFGGLYYRAKYYFSFLAINVNCKIINFHEPRLVA